MGGCKSPALSLSHLFYAALFTPCNDENDCNTKNLYSGGLGLKVADDNGALYLVSSLPQVRTTFTWDECSELPLWKVNAIRDWMYFTVKKKSINLGAVQLTGEQLLGFYLDTDTLTSSPTKSVRTRSMLTVGKPLDGFKSSTDRADEQKDLYTEYFKTVEKSLFKQFNLEWNFLQSAYRTKPKTDNIDVEWFAISMMSNEFQRMLGQDFLAPIGSIVIVLCWILFHTKSGFVGSLGMLQILLSLPFAYTIYRFVFGIRAFSQMHILAIFLVLGVGADDIFVLTDAWHQSKRDVKQKPGSTLQEQLTRRMAYAYSRTSIAVFNTSFTTAMAFVSTGISPMMSISTFGWFASVCICINYIFVITWTPTVILVHHLYVVPAYNKCVGRKVDEDSNTKEEKVDAVGRLFTKYYTPLLLKTCAKQKGTENVDPESGKTEGTAKGSWGSFVKPVSVALILIFLGNGIQGVYFTAQLTPPTKAEAWFPNDHMITGLTDRMTDNYLGGSDNSYVEMSWVMGIKSGDREASGFDQYKPDDNRALAIFDDKFDLYPEVNQVAFQKLCDYVENFKCKDSDGEYLGGCLDQTG